MSVESESSLPAAPAQPFCSSPPLATQYSLPPMDEMLSKSESITLQHVQQTQDVQTPKRAKLKRVDSDGTERPASAQHDRRDGSEEHSDIEADQELSDYEDADPAEHIDDFDWDQLHEEYHAAIKQFNHEEDELMEEWTKLMEFFRIWAKSGHAHETDRTYQRLQTRTMYVQNEEDELERKRKHYINVVRAFESALNLLRTNAMFRG